MYRKCARLNIIELYFAILNNFEIKNVHLFLNTFWTYFSWQLNVAYFDC